MEIIVISLYRILVFAIHSSDHPEDRQPSSEEMVFSAHVPVGMVFVSHVPVEMADLSVAMVSSDLTLAFYPVADPI